MPWGITPLHLIIVLVIVLIVLGPGKLPETGAALGRALRGFKDAVDGNEPNSAAQQPVAPVVPPAQAPVYQAPPPQVVYPAVPQQPYQPQPVSTAPQEPVPAPQDPTQQG